MIKLAVSGCQGRMGSRISELASQDKDFKIAVLLEHEGHPAIGQKIQGVSVQSEPSVLKEADVLIEFTTPEATFLHLRECLKSRVKMVIGTTGLLESQVQAIKDASRVIPIVFSSNMSVGVNIFFKIAREVAEKTGKTYNIKIVEAHHVHKKDAPSGTAKTLAQIVEEASKTKVSDIKSIRKGEIIGDHDIIFESEVDTIKISHSAKTRDIFVKGALVAAKFIAKKTKGLYDMQSVLGL